MSNVTPEFLEQYNYTLNLMNKVAEENRLGWLKIQEMFKKSEDERATEKAIRDTEQRKRDLEYKQIAKRMGQQEDRFGKFTESFVRHQLVRVLGDWGIKINRSHRNVEAYLTDGTKREFDAIAVNGDTVVFVEIKSTLQQNETEYFIENMKRIREMFPEYKDKKILAAIAFIHDAPGAIKMAQNVGLLTILATASSARITNDSGFVPAEF